MRPSDVELSRLVVDRGWLDEMTSIEGLQEADRCQALGLDKSLEEVLVERGQLSVAQVRDLRRALGWTVDRPRIGGFEIVRRVGLGGTGSVFEARHVRLGQRVALKVLYPRLAQDPRITARFLNEARALARLDHPNLVHAFDLGRDGAYFYLAMEFIEGENLLQVLTSQGPLTPVRSVEIVRAVVSGLAELERNDLIHRDIKPANILLDEEGSGRVKLADFGLLKRGSLAANETTDEWVCGTPHYLSPEQARGDGTEDIRSDLYSLGATWFHLLTGQPPFVGSSTREILIAHRSKRPPPLARVHADVPKPLERTLRRWLAKNPKDRPRSSAEALCDLDALADVVASAEHRASQSKSVVRSNPAPRRTAIARGSRKRVAAGVLLVIAVLVGAWLMWLWWSGADGTGSSGAELNGAETNGMGTADGDGSPERDARLGAAPAWLDAHRGEAGGDAAVLLVPPSKETTRADAGRTDSSLPLPSPPTLGGNSPDRSTSALTATHGGSFAGVCREARGSRVPTRGRTESFHVGARQSRPSRVDARRPAWARNCS